MPRAKKSTKTESAKNILSELTPEEKASFESGFRDENDWDDDDYSDDYTPTPTYANGLDPSKLVVNPITGTSKQTPPLDMSNFLPGIGPTVSSNPPVEPMPVAVRSHGYSINISVETFKDVSLLKAADLAAKIEAIIDSSELVEASSMSLNSHYYNMNDIFEEIRK